MRMLVLGATGNVGSHFVRLAREKGHEVTAVARREIEGGTLGDVLDGAFVDRIVPGHDAVMSGVGLRYAHPWAKREPPDDLVPRATANIIHAMRQSSVRRISIVSGAGVRDRKILNWVMKIMLATSNLKWAYQGLDRAEALLEESGLDWQAVRPVTLSHEPNQVARIGDGYPMTASVSREAVAAFMLNELEKPEFSARTPILIA